MEVLAPNYKFINLSSMGCKGLQQVDRLLQPGFAVKVGNGCQVATFSMTWVYGDTP